MRETRRRSRRLTAVAAGAGALLITAGVAQAHTLEVRNVVRGGEAAGERVGVTISRANRPQVAAVIARLRDGATAGPVQTRPGNRHRIGIASPARYRFASLECTTPGRRWGPAWRTTRIPVLDVTVGNGDVRCTVTHDRRIAVRVTARFAGPGAPAGTLAVAVAGAAPVELTDGTATAPVDVTGRSSATVALAGTSGAELPEYATALRCSPGVTVTRVGSGWRLSRLSRAPGSGVVDCTLTAERRQATLTVATRVVNDHGGTATPAGITVSGTAGDTAIEPFAGAAEPVRFTLPVGAAYRIAATAPAGYDVALSPGCEGTADADAVCTITADDIAARLTVVTRVINDQGGTAQPGDFLTRVAAAGAEPAEFPGSATGTVVTLSAGPYEVTQEAHPTHTTTLDAGCAGTIALGESRTCTIVNDDLPVGPEEPEQPPEPGDPGGEPIPAALPGGGTTPRLDVRTRAPERVAAPGRVTQTILVRNVGRGAARDIVILAKTPRGMRVVRASGGTVRAGTLTARVATLRPGARRVVRVTLAADRVARGRSVTTVSVRARRLAPLRDRIVTLLQGAARSRSRS